MKKLFLSFLILLTVPLVCSCSCSPVPQGYYVVSYVIDGEELYSAYAKPDEIIGMPVLEEREGFVFKGWYLTEEYIEKWDFEYDTVESNLTVYGYWVEAEAETFNVLYYNNDTLINYEKVPKGNNASAYSPPDRQGYEFNGWFFKESEFDFGSPITDDIILKAEWEAITYTIRFIADNETVFILEYTVESTDINIPEVPSKDYYTGEWSEFKFNLENTEVTAVYSPIAYTATFEADGKLVTKINYTVEDTVIIPDVPQKTGYSGKWLGLPVAGGDVTVTAEYTPIVYTITYKADGSEVETVKYTIESIDEISPPSVPAKPGFIGAWEEKIFTVGDVIINAVYTVKIYTATFIADGKPVGTCKFQFDDMTVEEPEIPAKEGYTAQWEAYTLGYEDIIIKAEYVPIVYTAKFFIRGTNVGSVNFTVEDKTLPTPDIKEWQGYCVEWETVAISANNLTVNALLTPITYYVTFIADGVEVAKVGYTVENKNIIVPSPPQKYGYNAEWESFNLTFGNITVEANYVPVSDAELNFKDEFTYRTESDGSLTVTGYYGEEKYLYVPSTHNGLQIKAIADLAFSGSDIMGIKLNEGVETICNEAFLNCKNLTEVLLPDSLKSIGKSAFAYCGFTEIKLPVSVDEIGAQAFAFSALKSVILPQNLKELDNIFYCCTDLENVVLNEKLNVIKANSFFGCSSLKSITIPSNIKLIEANAFAETVLESVTFEDIEHWKIYSASGIEISNVDYSLLADESVASNWLTRIYVSRYWKNSNK